jgi:protein MpaA
MRLLALLLATLPIGHSVEGRVIMPVVLGSAGAAHRVLVVGCIHGNETAGIAIVKRLIAAGAPAGTEIVAVTSVNPDGCANGTRQNAHGVDLNRNFPSNWARIGRRGSFQWSGPRPLSEPESRYAVELIERLEPQITIWFHQHQGFVRAWGQSIPTARRFAQLAAYPYQSVRWPFGTASNWQNHRFPRTASFVVELPAGPVPPSRVGSWVRAIRELAREGPRAP